MASVIRHPLTRLVCGLAVCAGSIASQTAPPVRKPPSSRVPSTTGSATTTSSGALDRAIKTLGQTNLPEEKMTKAEKVALWPGQKVTILGKMPMRCPQPEGTVSVSLRPFTDKETSRYQRTDLATTYVGQKGSLTEAKMEDGYSIRAVLQLDRGEKFLLSSDSIGFDSELEAAKAWVGRTVWAKGSRVSALPDRYICTESSKVPSDERLKIANLSPLLLTAVEYGTYSQPIYFQVKTADGQLGWLDGYSGTSRFDPRLRVTGETFEQSLYLTDPRKPHPTWPPSIWKLIVAEQVAIGMNEDQAVMACGGIVRAVGFSIGPDQDVAAIYRCENSRHNRDFVLEKGRVKEYAEVRRY